MPLPKPIERSREHGALSQWVMKHLAIPDDPHFINPPRRQLLTFLFVQWFSMYFAWLMMYNVLMYVAIPLFVWFFYIFHLFTNVWKAYGYSKPLLITMTVLANIVLFFLAHYTRACAAQLLLKFYRSIT